MVSEIKISKPEKEEVHEPKPVKQIESVTPRKGRPIVKKVGGGLFKAPPPNLIESLLLEESQDS